MLLFGEVSTFSRFSRAFLITGQKCDVMDHLHACSTFRLMGRELQKKCFVGAKNGYSVCDFESAHIEASKHT